MAIPNDLMTMEVLTRCRSNPSCGRGGPGLRPPRPHTRQAAPPSVLAVHTRAVPNPEDAAAPEDVCTQIHLIASQCDGLIAACCGKGGTNLLGQSCHRVLCAAAAKI
uniref:Uncharacterized protein n=1 Tax=Oryza glumipatula TaxID=40148 RepID=A0A0D9ZJX2_9ORYZ